MLLRFKGDSKKALERHIDLSRDIIPALAWLRFNELELPVLVVRAVAGRAAIGRISLNLTGVLRVLERKIADRIVIDRRHVRALEGARSGRNKSARRGVVHVCRSSRSS